MGRREKKSLWPLITLTVIFWTLLGGIILFVDPQVLKDFPLKDSYGLFFIVFWLAWFFLTTLVLNHSRRGLLLASGLTGIGMLKLIRLGNVVNVILLLGLLVVIDFYFENR